MVARTGRQAVVPQIFGFASTYSPGLVQTTTQQFQMSAVLLFSTLILDHYREALVHFIFFPSPLFNERGVFTHTGRRGHDEENEDDEVQDQHSEQDEQHFVK